VIEAAELPKSPHNSVLFVSAANFLLTFLLVTISPQGRYSRQQIIAWFTVTSRYQWRLKKWRGQPKFYIS
jgi:hypothetical protein